MKKKIEILASAALVALGLPVATQAKIDLPDIFSSNAVLQQQSDARLWGWATPGSTVSLVPSWSGKKVEVKADPKSGEWTAQVATPAASYTPYTLTIDDGDGPVTLTDILIGEVWFCSGQSNMEMPLRGFGFQPVEGAGEAIAYSGRYPGIRMANVPKTLSYTPQQRVPGKWKKSLPENAGEFSALAYFFARSLTDLLDVPVGIINCAYGGSKVEGWIPKEILDTYPEWNMDKEEKDSTLGDYERIGVMYNAMLKPLAGYTVKGFLWNQGESNVGRHDTYPAHQRDMVAHWRELWQQGDLPFYYVELPGWNYDNPEADNAAIFRECQQKGVQLIPNSGIVSTSDLVYPREVDDIHASKKKEIGERLAFMAGHRTYGIEGLPDQYPAFGSVELKGDKAVIRLASPYSGLNPYKDMPGFEVAGDDHVYYPATANQIQDNEWKFTIEVSSDKVKDVKGVRYNFKNFAVGTIHDMYGLPLVPFRTDDWTDARSAE
ncbi:MAG: sialate O-acetylesterase [Bacteroidales bacterium]|nr:sialate O-acetylesterase [Bacteroidales bacterium]